MERREYHFKKGMKKIEGSGMKKGHKVRKAEVRHQLEDMGIDIVREYANLIKDARNEGERKTLLVALGDLINYCYSKKPTKVTMEGRVTSVDHEEILKRYNIAPRE